MRPAVACLLFLALGGCSKSDPDWAKPCGQRRPASVFMGIGQYQYIRLGNDRGPFIDTDLQQGDFVWLGVGCEGLGPDATLSFGIKETATGVDLSITKDQRMMLSYDDSVNEDVAPGLQAFFQLPAGLYTSSKELAGVPVTVWADVTDACHTEPVHGEKATRLEGYDTSTCEGCIDQQCHVELGDCGEDCHDIQACLDTYCVHLSAIGSPEEADCQTYCQMMHPTGKDAHVAVVSCVRNPSRGAKCSTQSCEDNPVDGGPDICYVQPPCYPYSIDYRHCVNQQDDPAGGPCLPELDACNSSAGGACQAFKACVGACTTFTACEACAAAHPDGKDLFEKHQQCIERTCLAEGWLPHL